VPGPARRHVDLEGDLAAQALAGGGFAEGYGFCLFLFQFRFGKHLRPVLTFRHVEERATNIRHSGMVR
jgi:hypothetical protein